MRKDILMVRPGALGDTILTIPLIRSVQEESGTGKITFMGNSAYREILPPEIDFLNIDSMTLSSLFQEAPDLEDSPLGTLDEAILILRRPARLRDNLARFGVKDIKWIDPRPLKGVHMVRRLTGQLGAQTPEPHPFLEYLRPKTEREIVWVSPGAGGRDKSADLDLFLELARLIHDHYGWDTYLTLGPADRFVKESRSWPLVLECDHIKMIEGIGLTELCNLLGAARLFIGNDSGMSHLAAGMGIPAMVFFKCTDPEVWAPWTLESLLAIVRPSDKPLRGRELLNLIKRIIKPID
jgi:ADP-heptose:LPS heptosyltransferase